MHVVWCARVQDDQRDNHAFLGLLGLLGVHRADVDLGDASARARCYACSVWCGRMASFSLTTHPSKAISSEPSP